jgi:hypothetical protein
VTVTDRSLATAVSAGFTILAFSRHATMLSEYKPRALSTVLIIVKLKVAEFIDIYCRFYFFHGIMMLPVATTIERQMLG